MKLFLVILSFFFRYQFMHTLHPCLVALYAKITKQVSTSVVLFGLTQCGHMATLIWVNIGSDNYLNQCWLLISDVIFYSLEINFKASTMLLFCTTSLKIIYIFLNYCHISQGQWVNMRIDVYPHIMVILLCFQSHEIRNTTSLLPLVQTL